MLLSRVAIALPAARALVSRTPCMIAPTARLLHVCMTAHTTQTPPSPSPSSSAPSSSATLTATIPSPSSSHFKHLNHPSEHPLSSGKVLVPEGEWESPIHHSVWSQEEVLNVAPTHVAPRTTADKAAYIGVRIVRFGFDLLSGYMFGPINESKLLRRIIFLETVAGIPGMVAGSLRHLKSLRNMQRDHGWIPTLLSEADNERMHLLTFLHLKQPSPIFRAAVFVAQGIMWNTFFFAYLISPQMCHRFVGYIEEEAVKTYTGAIKALDDGLLPTWSHMPAPVIAKVYWQLNENAKMRDVLLAVRADEANHRDTNHVLSELSEEQTNPFIHKYAPPRHH